MSQLEAAIDSIRQVTDLRPQFAIILGSGLGGVVDHILKAVTIDFGSIPGFGTSTAGGHRGQMVIGTLDAIPVVALAGRLHRYGGWTTAQVTFPVEVMRGLGAERLIVSNAAGGVRPGLAVGDIVVIEDHVDWMAGNPMLRFASRPTSDSPAGDVAGVSTGTASSRWDGCDVLQRSGTVYDAEMMEVALSAARAAQFTARRGTYLAVLGPNYETRAEYRMMRRLGADVVGMSTVPEVLAAARLQMRILALSMVSNVASPDAPLKANHEEVLAAGAQAEPRMLAMVRAVLRHCAAG